MRSTVRIDDDLMEELRSQARETRVSLTRMLNRTLRRGLRASTERDRETPYREQPVAMGSPRVDLDKALTLAALLEDEEILRKLMLRK